MDMLIKVGDVKNAEDLFELITKKDNVTYGVIINGYSLDNEPQKSFELFEEMKQQCIVANEVIFTSLISACTQIGMRSRCQSIIDQIPLHLQNDRHLQNAITTIWASINCDY
jgi:pentatricopeptide repeat protein